MAPGRRHHQGPPVLPPPRRRATVAVLGACLISSVARSGLGQNERYIIERKGQDTFVRRASDDSVVYTTSVADTSEGSDTDSDIRGDEEFFHGCLWTFRQQLGLCEGGSCGEAELMAYDLQRRLLTFYRARTSPAAPPPLEDAAWLTLGTRPEQRREIFESCPGLVVTVLLFVAEALAFAGMAEAEAYAREAEGFAAALQVEAPQQFETMLEMFPVAEAWQGYHAVRGHLQGEAGMAPRQPSVDIVIARCSSPLQWLWELDYPQRSRLFVYDKCKNSAVEFEEQTAGLRGVLEAIEHRPMEEVGEGLMTGECTAYAMHIIRALRANALADYTVFVHDDAPRHIRLSLLSLALRGMRSGAYDVPFLHLSHERYPSFRTRCLRDVYQRVFGEELTGTLGTYCCSHFVVQRSRIEARGPAFFERLLSLVGGAPYAQKHGGECNIGSKPCYVMEFMWHRVFGEADELPPRSEQGSLPLALRYEGGRASQLPTPLKVAPYMAMFQPSRYSKELERSR